MKNKRAITTLEQVKVNGGVRERKATHIVTGAHGYETLCTRGHSIERNEKGDVIVDFVKLDENQLPITCSTCYVIWHDTFSFSASDFNTESVKGKLVDTTLADINL